MSPRDRLSTFAPRILPKRVTDIAGLEDKIIGLYAKGLSTRDIATYIKDIYKEDISAETISNVTDKVLPKVKEWQNRPLTELYTIVYLDGMVVKVRYEGIVKNICIYGIIGIDLEGNKEILGLYVAETEGAKYWLTVMNELKNRGVKDVLIFSVDNLSGISEAIQSVYPKAEIQKCLVHQIRNSLKYVSWKERKEVATDLKKIYTAVNEKRGIEFLEEFSKKWDKKYPHISKSWRANWSELITFFKYPNEIRRLIYTSNPIESFNRGIRKVIKNKAIFPHEDAVLKIMYLAIQDMEKRWTTRLRNWGFIFSQLSIFFEKRIKDYVY